MRNDFESNYLEHSAKGTTWSKKGAKYIERFLKNGKWVYRYKITGRGYKRDAREARGNAIISSSAAKKYKEQGNQKFTSGKTAKQRYHEEVRAAETYGRKSAEAESNYYTKSLAGNIERGTKKIAQILDSLKTQETVTVTSNLMPARTKKKIK